MTEIIEQSLASLATSLRELGLQVVLNALQPGLDEHEFEDAWVDVPLPRSEELASLYAWRNGVSSETTLALGQLWIAPGWYFPAIEASVANYRTFRNDTRWNHRWFPVLSDGGGDFYAVELGRLRRPKVRHFQIEDVEHPVEYESLSALFATWAEAYRRGIFVVDDDGWLDMDDAAFDLMAAELNPRVKARQ